MSHSLNHPASRILFISHDVVSANMAGPGIRSLELARVLRDEGFEVVLASPNKSELNEAGIRPHAYEYGNWESIKGAVEGVDLLICTGFSLYEFPALVESDLPIVVDLYDPFPLENLYLFADSPQKPLVHLTDMAIVETMCTRGDFFLCANQRQRDWWLGVLLGKGRINPPTVTSDHTLHELLVEVPFGMPSRPFDGSGVGPRESIPELEADDRLILWGGGLWNWLDPITLIRAMPAVLAEEPRARLLFPGTRHPNQHVPEMERAREAIALTEELGLSDTIFFGEWVPYESWAAYLDQADVAVSLHYDTIETQFSAVRSRVLSYIWARLPIVATEGDSASRLIERHGLGEIVGYEDVDAVSAALLTVLRRDPAHYEPAFDAVSEQFTWHNVARPLVQWCRAPRRAPDAEHAWQEALSEQRTFEGQWQRMRRQEEEIGALQRTIHAYEQGRFMQLMRGLHTIRERLMERIGG